MITLTFWKAAAERGLSTGAQSVLAVVGVAQFTNALTLDWATLGGVFLGGVFLSVVKSVAVGKLTDGGPSLAGEVLEGGDA
jgi:hypothetical protein